MESRIGWRGGGGGDTGLRLEKASVPAPVLFLKAGLVQDQHWAEPCVIGEPGAEQGSLLCTRPHPSSHAAAPAPGLGGTAWGSVPTECGCDHPEGDRLGGFCEALPALLAVCPPHLTRIMGTCPPPHTHSEAGSGWFPAQLLELAEAEGSFQHE